MKPGPKPKYGTKATKQLNICLTPEMYRLLEMRAQQAGLGYPGGLTEWARRVLIIHGAAIEHEPVQHENV